MRVARTEAVESWRSCRSRRRRPAGGRPVRRRHLPSFVLCSLRCGSEVYRGSGRRVIVVHGCASIPGRNTSPAWMASDAPSLSSSSRPSASRSRKRPRRSPSGRRTTMVSPSPPARASHSCRTPGKPWPRVPARQRVAHSVATGLQGADRRMTKPASAQIGGAVGRVLGVMGEIDPDADDDGELAVSAASCPPPGFRRAWRRRAAGRSAISARARLARQPGRLPATASCRATPATKPSCGDMAGGQGARSRRLA